MVVISNIMDDDDDLEALRLAALQTIRPRAHPIKQHGSQQKQFSMVPFVRPITNPNLIAIVPTEVVPAPGESAVTSQVLKARQDKVNDEVKSLQEKDASQKENSKPNEILRHKVSPKGKSVVKPLIPAKSTKNADETGFDLEEDVLDFDAESLHEEEDLLQLHDSDSDSLEKLMEDIEKELSDNVKPIKPRTFKTRQAESSSIKAKSPPKQSISSRPKSPNKVKKVLSPPREEPTAKAIAKQLTNSQQERTVKQMSPLRRTHSPRPRSPRKSPLRKRSPSPFRKRSLSPLRKRSPSPFRKRSPSPLRKRSLSPSQRRRSPSPRGRRSPFRKRSLSPRRRSPSPPRRRSPLLRKLSPRRRSISPRRFSPRRRSISPRRRRSISPRRRSISPWRRSPSSRGRRSPSPLRRRSPSPLRRRSPTPLRKRSPSPLKKSSRSPLRKRSPSPPRKRSFSPLRKRSPSPLRKRSLSPHHKRSSSPHSSPFKRKRSSPDSKRRPTQHPFSSRSKQISSSGSTRQEGYQGSKESDKKEEEERAPKKKIDNEENGDAVLDPKLEARKRKFENNYVIEAVNKKICLKSEKQAESKSVVTGSVEEKPQDKKENLKELVTKTEETRGGSNQKTEDIRLSANLHVTKTEEVRRSAKERISKTEETRISAKEHVPKAEEARSNVKERVGKSIADLKSRLEKVRAKHKLEMEMKEVSSPPPEIQVKTKRKSQKKKRIILAEEQIEDDVEVIEEQEKPKPLIKSKRSRKKDDDEKKGGDLRAELSRRRAERLKGSVIDPMARIVQSALEGAVGNRRIKSKSKPSRPSPPSDSEDSPPVEKKSRPKGRRVISIPKYSIIEGKNSDDDDGGNSMGLRLKEEPSPPRNSGRSILRRNQV